MRERTEKKVEHTQMSQMLKDKRDSGVTKLTNSDKLDQSLENQKLS